ncbi:MAG: reverse transcriptase family protein, partial [Gammaproteobacteria bacterium]|nr:reverse transcriptase family protein [Gammaproteobacteria bacterium]
MTKINSNKAHGPDGIHGKLLKNCAVGLAYPLSLLFNLCYNTGSLPEEWKLGHVVPIFKKGNKHDVCNYRPISLTSLVAKTLERILKEELLAHVHHHIDKKQHGFLPNKSCTTNLVGLCDSLALSLNENIRTDVIYFDFAKAFDSVNHDIILHKLKSKFGIDGRLLKFLANYLRDRQQCVLVGGKLSSSLNVRSGVPQGSILGPILFVLFINDISDGISPETKLSLYADDTKIWRPILTGSDTNRLQKDIEYLYDWSLRNKMKFHPDKCKVLSVTGKLSETLQLLSVLPFYNFIYSLGGESIDYVES